MRNFELRLQLRVVPLDHRGHLQGLRTALRPRKGNLIDVQTDGSHCILQGVSELMETH